ncbi:MAG: glycosyltransferase family 39 protein, partial [Cyanobacteria bacterium J06649_4]
MKLPNIGRVITESASAGSADVGLLNSVLLRAQKMSATMLSVLRPRGLFFVLLLASVLRFYQLGHEGLWADEMNSIQDSEQFWAEPSARRPLYYILLNLWMQVDPGDVWLRGLAAIFGIGSVWLTYRLGMQVLNKRTGLLAALLVTLSPLFINHSQEIRMYSLSSFLSLLGSLCFLQVLARSLRFALVGWAVSRWLAVLTMPLNIFLLLPDALLFVFRWWQRPRLVGWVALGGLGPLVATLPTL